MYHQNDRQGSGHCHWAALARRLDWTRLGPVEALASGRTDACPCAVGTDSAAPADTARQCYQVIPGLSSISIRWVRAAASLPCRHFTGPSAAGQLQECSPPSSRSWVYATAAALKMTRSVWVSLGRRRALLCVSQ